MRILLIDSLFQQRDPAQTDMYVLMSTKHKLITDGDIWQHVMKQDYDILWLGIYHHRLTIDWDQVLRYNTKPVVIDQADNEEFIQAAIRYSSLAPVTVLSRYLPHEGLTEYCKQHKFQLKYLPWYVNPDRFPLFNKTCDVAFICTMHESRLSIRDELIRTCKRHGYTYVIGEYWGNEYAVLLAKCRYVVIECARKCLTQKYIEAALTNTILVGDIPVYPENELKVIPSNVRFDLSKQDFTQHNREYVLNTFANKSFFLNHLNQIL